METERIDWDLWLRSRPGDIRRPDRVITPLGDGWYCQLCSRSVNGSRAEHHLGHMLKLDDHLARRKAEPEPKPDSERRLAERRERRQEAFDRAAALGEEPVTPPARR
jgi:hypothetical protein